MPQFFVNVTAEGYYTIWADDADEAEAKAREFAADNSTLGLETDHIYVHEAERVEEAG